MQDKLVLLDYDHSVARMAARMLRSERICCKIFPWDTPAETIFAEDPSGLILCAAHDSVFADPEGLLRVSHVPVLALGAAAAGMAVFLGGSAGTLIQDQRMTDIRLSACPLLSGMTFGTLLELELHDPDSRILLTNFAQRICCCTAWWDEDAFVSQAVGDIRRAAGEGTALCVMTGGLHASVSALLGARALGDRMIGVFVNTGLLQEEEESAFERFFAGRIRLPLVFLDESQRFLHTLRGIRDQEEKRSAVHSLLNVVTREIQRQYPDLTLIIQDRTFADQPQEDYLSLRRGVSLLEPLQDLFLDEVRQVGSYLGLPYDMIAGQIIPDTGLALNIIGEVTEEKLSVLRRSDAIFRSILRQSGQSKKLSEYYAVLRPYEKDTYSVILRALGFHQGDTIRPARPPYDILEESAERIRQECPQVKRVLYDLTPTSRQ